MKNKPSMTPQEEQELRKNPINQFVCGNCKDAKPMNFKEFRAHLLEVHQLKGELKGTKQMRMHMDGDVWFSSSYDWTLDGGLTFNQFTKMARSDDDAMRYNH